MEFINKSGKDMKIKILDGADFSWMTVKSDEVVDISEKVGLANGLEKVEDKAVEAIVEEEQIVDEAKEEPKKSKKDKKPKKSKK